MCRLVLALFVLLPLVVFARVGGAPPVADAGVGFEVELLLDCNTATPGVQSVCVALPGTAIDVDYVVKNNGASTVRQGAFNVSVFNPDTSRLFAPQIIGMGTENWNPDAFAFVPIADWACSPPDPTNDGDSNPSTQTSFINCHNGTGSGPEITPGGIQTLATVHYNVPTMAQPGSVALTFTGAAFDWTISQMGYGCPSGPGDGCAGATITIPTVSIAVDCNVAQTGIQTKCYTSNMLASREVEVVFRNHTMAPIALGVFNFTLLNNNIARLSALVVNNPGYMDDNPDAHPNLTPLLDWNCGPLGPDNDTDLDGDPVTEESFMSCMNAMSSGPSVMQMNYLAVAKVRYGIQAGAYGSVVLSPKDAGFYDATFTERGTCNPIVTAGMLCQSAEVVLYCPIDQADVTGTDGRVNSGDIGKVASKFGQIPAPVIEDQNFDGLINSGDLGLVASVFNRYVSECP